MRRVTTPLWPEKFPNKQRLTSCIIRVGLFPPIVSFPCEQQTHNFFRKLHGNLVPDQAASSCMSLLCDKRRGVFLLLSFQAMF